MSLQVILSAKPEFRRGSVRHLGMALGVLLSISISGCAHSPPEEPLDPLEPVNRVIWDFNRTVDRYTLRPVARVYARYTPDPVRTGISNFFGNLFYPTVIVSDVLQAKFEQGAMDTGRFLINSTVGVVGIFDVAKHIGLPRHYEDIGQAFGRWGVGQGWFLMMPLAGPTTNRDLTGNLIASYLSPLSYVDSEIRVPLTVLYAVDIRATLLRVDRVLDAAFDPYTFVRGAYLQRREAQVRDEDSATKNPGLF